MYTSVPRWKIFKNKTISHHSPPASFPQSEKAAPIIGPMRKPRENATPIIAIPLPLVEGVDTSVTIAVDRDTFPAATQDLYPWGIAWPTLWYSTQNPSQDKYGEVGGENPEQVGESNACREFLQFTLLFPINHVNEEHNSYQRLIWAVKVFFHSDHWGLQW